MTQLLHELRCKVLYRMIGYRKNLGRISKFVKVTFQLEQVMVFDDLTCSGGELQIVRTARVLTISTDGKWKPNERNTQKSLRSITGLYIDKYCVKYVRKTRSFSWTTSLSLLVIWHNLPKDFHYLSLVKSCYPILTVGAIAVSNPRPQLVTDAKHFACVCVYVF